jgi:hypothetical protein
VVDAIDGDVSDSFVRDLAQLVRGLVDSGVRLVAFGKAPMLRQVVGSERPLLRVTSAPVYGFTVEEFQALVATFGTNNGDEVREIFTRMSAGRTDGITAQMAGVLARLSIEEMRKVASLPPEQAVIAAEHVRFNAIPESLRRAAERIVCMILPFRASDVAALFPDEPIEAAIWGLEMQGLLQRYDPERCHHRPRRCWRAGLMMAIAAG